MSEKNLLRSEIRRRLRLLRAGPGGVEHSRAICAAISGHPAYAAARVVASFSPLPSEPCVDLLWPFGAKRFLYPRVTLQGLEWVETRDLEALRQTSPEALLREPTGGEVRALSEADVVLVPGLAFTREGHRLGRGGGYYDRALAQTRAGRVTLGICFACQLVETLPQEPHDMQVDDVITENGLCMRN